MNLETLQEMQILARVVQAGSLSAAARQLGCSPASVSRALNALEDALGVKLLNRSSRNISLTDAGELYLQRIEGVLHDVQEAREAVVELGQVPRGVLHVHARMTVGVHHVVSALPEFLARYPAVSVNLTLSDERLDLVDHKIDVAIHSGAMEDSALIARTLATSPRFVVASPEYLERHSPPVSPRDLGAHKCLTYRFDLGVPVWRLARDGGEEEARLESYLQSNNGDVLRLAALKGLGLALLPEWQISEELRSGRLVRVLSEYRVGHGHLPFDNVLYAVYQPTRHLSPKVRAFVDYLAGLFRERSTRGWYQSRVG